MTISERGVEKGFTLIELLVVIGILAVLLAITLIAINPARQFAQANDTKRRSDITQVLNAVGQYFAEHHGILPAELASLAASVSAQIGGQAGMANVCADLVPIYIPAMPRDPRLSSPNEYSASCPLNYTTDYQISHDAMNRVTVQAQSEINKFSAWGITTTR